MRKSETLELRKSVSEIDTESLKAVKAKERKLSSRLRVERVDRHTWVCASKRGIESMKRAIGKSNNF